VDTDPFQLDLGVYKQVDTDLTQGLDVFLDQVSQEMILNISYYEDLSSLEDQIINGTIDTGMVVNATGIEVVGAPNRTIAYRVTKQLADTFDHHLLMSSYGPYEADRQGTRGYTLETVTFKGENPTAMDYYAVTMLAMFMMYGTLYGGEAIKLNYYGVRGERIRSSSIRFYQHFIGLALGTTLTIGIQGAAVVLFSKFVYGVNFGESLMFVLFVVFSFALMATGLGMMVSVLSKDSNKGLSFLNALVPVTTLISGGFATIGSDGIIGVIQKFAPNYHLHEIMLNYIFETSQTVVQESLLMIWVMILVSFSGALIFRKKVIA